MSAPPAPTLRLCAQYKPEPALLPLVVRAYAGQKLASPIPVEWHADADLSPQLVLAPSGEVVQGSEAVIKQLLNMYASHGIAGADKTQSDEIASYLSTALSLPTLAFDQVGPTADALDDRLALRTYIVGNGHSLTAADALLWAAVRSASALNGLLKKGQHVHLARWASFIDETPAAAEASDELKGAKAVKARANTTKAASFDIFLPGAQKGGVVTRFPPEPSGYLHLGHTKAAILNSYFAREYKGRLLIRFDDTNPSKEKAEFEDSIIEDLRLLGIKGDSTSHTSDYFDQLYKLAIQLIKSGDAYADDTQQEEMRANRMDGIASKRREASVEENMERFAEMSTASEEGRKWCLRAKMSVDNPNKAMRDPVIYRCNPDVVHHRTGTTWKVYPTYDFACPVVDALEGITHALRTNEYRDRNPQYQWFLEKLQLRKVEIWDFGRLNFVYTLLSKRKLQWFVDNGHVSGWDDPRFPTVRGVRRRGMTIECIHQFILATGPSQQVINMEWDAIWATNKRMIDPVVPRFTALETQGLVKCIVKGVPEAYEKTMPRHKKNAELGTKTTIFSPNILLEQVDAASFADNEEVTLMDWGNAFVRRKHLAADGSVESIEFEANLEGDFRKTDKKVTWLAADAPPSSAARRLVDVVLLDYDYLITKKKLEEEDKFEDFVTPTSEFATLAQADANVAELTEGTSIQFERKGYYILDKVQGREGKREFIRIPDGKAETSKSKAGPDDGGTAGRKEAAAKARAQKGGKSAVAATEKAGESVKSAATAVAGAAAGAAAAVGAAVGLGSNSNDAKPSSMYHVAPLNGKMELPPSNSTMYNMRSFY